jgi:hypothetical protein
MLYNSYIYTLKAFTANIQMEKTLIKKMTFRKI